MKIKQKSIIWEKKLKDNCIIRKNESKNNISITIKARLYTLG